MLRQVLAIVIALSFGVAPAFPVLRPIEGLCCRAAKQTACAVEAPAAQTDAAQAEHSCCAAKSAPATSDLAAANSETPHRCGDSDSHCGQVCCYVLVGLWACAPPLAAILAPAVTSEQYPLPAPAILKSFASEIFRPSLVV